MKPRSRTLPIVFRSLDVESKSKPVPTLVCPVRSDLMTAGNCGRCASFRRIDFTDDGQPVLCCATDPKHGELKAHVHDLLRVPVVCAVGDTTLAVVLPYLSLGTPLDVIPVLDADARPIGSLTIRDARRLVAAGIPLDTTLAEVISRQIVCVLPETTLADAGELLAETEAAQLFAVGPDGVFLGVLSRRDVAGVMNDMLG